jgi:hypothetical protein
VAGACAKPDRDFPPLGVTGGAGGSGGGLGCTPDAVEACYSGPEGSEGKGLCKAGTHVCNKEGTGFDACVGEVLPKAEDCTTAADEACNGTNAMECTPLGYVWSKAYGEAITNQWVRDVAVTPDGDLIVVGSFGGMIDFGGNTMGSTGNTDIFIARVHATGEHVWSKRFGDASGQDARAVVVDPAGNIYVGGNVEGSVDFGDGIKMSAGGQDAFVAKLGPGGDVLWSKLFGGTDNASVLQLGLTPTNQLVLAGTFGSTVSFEGPTLTSAGGFDLFVAKLDESGFHVSSNRYGGTGTESVNGLSIDSKGAVLLTGSFDSTIEFVSGIPLTTAGAADVYVAKLSSTLSTLWAKRWGDAKTQVGLDVAVAPGDEVLLTGHFTSTLNFNDMMNVLESGGQDLYLARLSSSGQVLSAQSFGTVTPKVKSARLAVDAVNGQIVIAGQFLGGVDFGGGELTSANNASNPFLAKLSLTGGGHIASRSFPSGKVEQSPSTLFVPDNGVVALALLPSGDPVIGGSVVALVDFGGGAIGPSGVFVKMAAADAFLARLLH